MTPKLVAFVLAAGAAALISAAKPKARPATRPAAAPARKAAKPPASRPPYPPTSDYDVRRMEGWKVHVHRELLTTEKADGDKALKLLEAKLYDINRVVPPKALADLHKIPIWISARDRQGRHPCACYHPSREWLAANGYNPDKAGSVDILNAGTFYDWTTHSQPWMVLHELAHGYHHRFLPGGYGNKALKDAYKRMVAGKKYESVLYFTGKKRRAYGLNNLQEYFAELTEAFYGANDFYPFVRAEVRAHDPEMYTLLQKLWRDQRR